MRISAIVLSVLPVTTQAEDLAPPPGCTDVVTIQGAECSLRRIWSCQDQPDAYLAASYTENGPDLLRTITFEGAIIRSGAGPDSMHTELGQVADPVSVTNLLATGSDSYDYEMVNEDGSVISFAGTSKLTGETVLIDGRTLNVVSRYDVFTGSDGVTRLAEGVTYYDAGLRLGISGVIFNAETGEQMQDRTPIDFIFPGETGFETITPVHGCPG